MRPLNRPMFRYGGPIKEGIMTGMQDRKAALVGDPAFPMDQSGRGMYSEQQLASNLQRIKNAFSQAAKQTASNIKTKPISTLGPGKKLGIVGNFLRRNFGRIKDFGQRQIGKLDMPPQFKSAGPQFKGAGTAGGGSIPTTMFERIKGFALRNPKTTIGGGYLASGPVVDIATGSVPLVERGLKQVADLAVPDFIFDQDKYFEDKKIAELNAQRQELEAKKKLEGKEKTTDDTVKKIDRDAEIQANRERYYKILGIDKMKKDSIYDSLIDASKIVTEEGGDLKGAIKSGTLQTRLIDAISKNLDKSADIKRQIDSAIVKAEIEKDVNKDKNALDRLVKEKQLKVLDNQLKGGTLQEVLTTLQSKQGIVPEGPELAALAIQKDITIPTGHTLNTKDVNNFLKDNPTLTVVDYLNDQNLKLQQAGKGSLTPGNYVVGKNILEVGEDGTVTDIIV
jgi:hypothetical protein